MADEQQSDPASLSWHERETLGALRRVANARSQLAALESEKPPAPLDPTVTRALEQNQADLAKARAKTTSRFGAGAARARVTELEAQQRLLLDRLGLASYDAYLVRRDTPPTPIADPAIIDFARRELQAAEAAWLQVQTLVLPEEEEPTDDAADGRERRDGRGRDGAPSGRDADGDHRDDRGDENANVVPYSRPAAS